MGANLPIATNLPLILQSGIFIALLLAASVIDIQKRIIPDLLCLAIALSGLFCFEPVKLLGILACLPLFIAALLCGGMGGGDIKLMAASGCVLGLQGGIAAMLIGLSAMLVFHIIYFILLKLRRRVCPKAYPLAPFLTLGCIIAYFLNNGGIPL